MVPAAAAQVAASVSAAVPVAAVCGLGAAAVLLALVSAATAGGRRLEACCVSVAVSCMVFHGDVGVAVAGVQLIRLRLTWRCRVCRLLAAVHGRPPVSGEGS